MVCLLFATACASDGGDKTPASSPAASSTTVLQESTDETTTTEPPETTPSTAASTTTEPSADDTPVTTTAPESAPLPSGDTVEVPFFVIDASIPAGWTCASVSNLAGFNVTFSDEVGERTVVEARTESVPLPDGVVNTTCAEGPYNGTTALFFAAVLDAPAVETYQAIELRFPFVNGVGSDQDITVYEMITQAEATAGLYIEVNAGGQVPLNPSQVEDFPPPS